VLIASPNQVAGGFFLDTTSNLWGAEINGLCKAAGDENTNLDLFAGFRYLDLDEDLTFGQVSTLLPGGAGLATGPLPAFGFASLTPGSTFEIRDGFQTRNQFYGAQLGALLELRMCRLYCYFLGKVALGTTHQVVTIHGNSQLFTPGLDPQIAPGGLYAVGSNIGTYERDEFTVVPEGQFNFGYQVAPWMRVFCGYTFMYWSSVARPGQQIDRAINLQQVPLSPTFNPLLGPRRPIVPFDQSNFWAQGLNFGFAVRF
jgi:hypothetical protein